MPIYLTIDHAVLNGCYNATMHDHNYVCLCMVITSAPTNTITITKILFAVYILIISYTLNYSTYRETIGAYFNDLRQSTANDLTLVSG